MRPGGTWAVRLVMAVHVLTGRAEVRLRLAKCLSANCLLIFPDKPVCCYPLTESVSPASGIQSLPIPIPL